MAFAENELPGPWDPSFTAISNLQSALLLLRLFRNGSLCSGGGSATRVSAARACNALPPRIFLL
jgi:hypothetical protein